jgi:hypothetical protein
LFADVNDVPTLPPPELGSPQYLQERAETLRLGGVQSSLRKPEETQDAFFWAYQTSQRGFVNLAVQLLASHRPGGGVYAEARVMAELTAALAAGSQHHGATFEAVSQDDGATRFAG